MRYSIVAMSLLYSMSSQALTAREEAWKLHNRLTGVPPQKTVLANMTADIERGDREAAAETAMNNPFFINVVMKNWVKPWSNREQSSRVALNDYVATVLGVIKDDKPFNTVLTEDILYIVDGAQSAYSTDNNNHYRDAETTQTDFNSKLTEVSQSATTGLMVDGVAGITTTRASGVAFFSAGTNRRVNRFTFINYLCNDYEALHDTTVPDSWVRRDVERNPGDDSRTYKNKCVGCHAGQDALGGAWAYYDFNGTKLVYTPGMVVEKVARPINNYPSAKPVTDDTWANMWTSQFSPQNGAKIGWRGATSGQGGKALNYMLSRSRAFSTCMSKKVFKLVCMKEAASSTDMATVEANATYFESTVGYSMKSLIARTAAGCVADE